MNVFSNLRCMEIPKAKELEKKVFAINNEEDFHSIALELYSFQYAHNTVYHRFCNAVNRTPATVGKLTDIPFLPVSFFKTHEVTTTSFEPELEFKSSGTTGMASGVHLVKTAELYKKSFTSAFNRFFGDIKEYCILGLLPSYLERGNSSLVYMVKELIKESGHTRSGFYLCELEKLNENLRSLEKEAQKTILFGVTYAFLDFIKAFPQKLSHTIVIETGGMKGRGKEMTKSELYEELKHGFGVPHIHSEYGMTELLSQAYAVDGTYTCPPWMKILLRDETDPFYVYPPGQPCSGAINVIDLANIYSCCFIATDDVGKMPSPDKFEIHGRMDHSDIRGCSLMLAQ